MQNFLFVLVLLFVATSSMSQITGNSTELQLAVTAPESNVVGRGIPLTVALRNNSHGKLEVITLETARIHFVLQQLSSDSRVLASWEAQRDGKTHLVEKKLPGGETLVKAITTKQKTTVLNTGEKSELRIEMHSLFSRYLGPGRYVLSVSYEDRLKAEVPMMVEVDDNETIPALIELIDNGAAETKKWARNTISILVGEPVSALHGKRESTSIAEAEHLRIWWKTNQSLIRLKKENLLPERSSPNADPK